MRFELLKPTQSGKGLFAVEKISLLYNLITSVIILCLFRQMDHPGQMLIDRVCLAMLTVVLMYLYRLAPCRLTAFVRVAIQMSLLSYWYPDTFEFNRVFLNLDHLFASAEQWLFGGQPALWFSLRWPQMWVSEALNMGYFCYYPMILVVVVWYFLFRYNLFEKVSFVVVCGFFCYYLIYIFVPVAGPQFYFPAIGLDQVMAGIFPSIGDYFNHHQELLPGPGCEEGFFYQLVEGSQEVGERPTAAFPSSHVGMSTILMIMSWRGSKRLFLALLPFYLLLCGATVYIQAHYLIDALMGFLSAFIIYIGVTWLYKRYFATPEGAY